ncbi:MAG TPA: hypothetical protein VF772_15765, partial [Terriglobales bacterium]
EKVLDAVGEAVTKLRRELGESLASLRKYDTNLQAATTSSLQALNAYSRGQKISVEHGNPRPALPYYLHAIEIDPDFAMAYRAAGLAYASIGLQERAHDYQTKAFELRQRTSDRERLSIEAAYYADVTGELQKAAQVYLELLDHYPNETMENLNLATIYSKLGDWHKGLEFARRASPPLAHSRDYYLSGAEPMDHYQDAVKGMSQVQLEKIPEALYLLAFADGDRENMARYLRLNGEGPSARTLASDSEAYFGRVHTARALVDEATAGNISEDQSENGAITLSVAAQWKAAYGNPAAGREMATKAINLVPNSPSAGAEAALAFALAGDTARAESLAQDLEKRFPLDEQMHSIWLPAVRGQIALNRKDPSKALQVLGAPAQIEAGNIQFITNATCLYTVYVRGNAYLAAGDGGAAATEFQRITNRRGLVGNCWTGALARLGLARAYAMQRDKVKAKAAYQDFLTLWKDADPDIPVLQQAKAEYAKLQ